MKCEYCGAKMKEAAEKVWVCGECPNVLTVPRVFIQ